MNYDLKFTIELQPWFDLLKMFLSFTLCVVACYVTDRLSKSYSTRSMVPNTILTLSAAYLSNSHNLGTLAALGVIVGAMIFWIILFHWMGQIPFLVPLRNYLLVPLWDFRVAECVEEKSE